MYICCTQGQDQGCLVEKSLKGIGRVKNVTISQLATKVSSLTFITVCLTSPEPSNFSYISDCKSTKGGVSSVKGGIRVELDG